MSEWLAQPLGSLANFQKGRKVETSEHLREGFAPYLGASAISGVVEEYGDMRAGVIAAPGEVLMLWDGERSGLVGKAQAGVISSTVARLSPKADVEGEYLYYALDLKFEWIQGRRTGTGVPHVPKDLARILSISYPKSRNEQRRIAEILATLDEAIEQTKALIAKHQQIKAGMMHDLFTRGVTPDGHLRPTREQAPDLYKESPLGWIPKEWEVSRCDSEFVIDSGITIGPYRRPKKSSYAYLRVANVYRDQIVLDDVTQLEASFEEVEAKKLKRYDLLVVEGHANRNEIGRCAMVFNDAEGMLFQNHLFRLRAVRLDPRYSLLWLNSPRARHYWDSMCSTSSGLNTINRRLLGSMPILLPLQEEQRLIASAVFSCREEEVTNANHLAKLRQQKHGLMHDLLTGRVRVMSPESEPAHA